MNPYLAKYLIFLPTIALGIWGFVSLPLIWGVVALITAFLIGGSLSMWAFKRLATPEQIKEDLEARLHND